MASALELSIRNEGFPLSKRFGRPKKIIREMDGSDIDWKNGINFVDPNTGFTPLMVAALQGKTKIIVVLIERGANILYKEKFKGRTALSIAAKYGRTESVRELVKRGCLVNDTDNSGMTPLMHAAKSGFTETVSQLREMGAGINLTDNNGYTAMHFAAKFGHVQTVSYLFDYGAAVELRETCEGKTALHLASQHGRRETVQFLLDHEAKVNRRSAGEKFTALMLASKEGFKATVSLLIARGADANLVDRHGWSALHFASSWGRPETAQILVVEGGADVNSREDTLDGKGGTPPIVVAAKGSQLEAMRVLLSYGAEVDLPEMHHGKTALASAAEHGLPEVVQFLVDFNANVNNQNQFTGTTPLMLSAAAGRRRATIALLDNFADINILDRRGRSAYEHALIRGQRDVFLSAIPHVSAAGKVNLIPWLEMICPTLTQGSLNGGPAEFLNSVLYTRKGAFNGLRTLAPDCDVYVLFCLVMLLATCKRSLEAQPRDAPELGRKVVELERMLEGTVTARAMSSDWRLTDAFLLGSKSCRILGVYHIRHFASCFFHGPLALYLENDLTRLLCVPDVACKIRASFFTNLREPGKTYEGYGKFGYGLLRARYCPALMLCLEGVSRLILFSLIAYYSVHVNGTEIYDEQKYEPSRDFHSLEALLILLLICWVCYEFGLMEEKRWAVSPSVVFSYPELEHRRLKLVITHFGETCWKVLDLFTYYLQITWVFLLLFARVSVAEDNDIMVLAQKMLLASLVPLALGLLRYPAAFYEPLSHQMLTIFLLFGGLIGFLCVFLATGLGFGIIYYAVFRDEIVDFRNPGGVVVVLFSGVLMNYDTNLFDGSPSFNFGVVISGFFLFWAVVVLFNALIGYFASNYQQCYERAQHLTMLQKARYVQQFSLVLEKSPMCMLPPLLNLPLIALYPCHVYWVWKEKFKSSNLKCLSPAGIVADLLLALLFLVPAATQEYFQLLWESELGEGWMLLRMLLYPIGVLFPLVSLLRKALFEARVMLLVKSRLSDGRLRISYGKERDGLTSNTLANFEDPRLFQTLDLFKDRYDPDEDSVLTSMQSKSTIKGRRARRSSLAFAVDLMKRGLGLKRRDDDYRGRKVRVQPSSPFLQLANISKHSITTIQSALPKQSLIHPQDQWADRHADDSAKFPTKIGAAAGDELSPWRQTVWGMEPSGDVMSSWEETPEENMMERESVDSMEPLDQKETDPAIYSSQVVVPAGSPRKQSDNPPLLLQADGSISFYQPGFSSFGELQQFSETREQETLLPIRRLSKDARDLHNESTLEFMRRSQFKEQQDYDEVEEEFKSVAREVQDEVDEDAVRALNNPSAYFQPHCFYPYFLELERKRIFQAVLPEVYVDDFSASVQEQEVNILKMQKHLLKMERNQEMLLSLIGRMNVSGEQT